MITMKQARRACPATATIRHEDMTEGVERIPVWYVGMARCDEPPSRQQVREARARNPQTAPYLMHVRFPALERARKPLEPFRVWARAHYSEQPASNLSPKLRRIVKGR